MNPRLLFKLSLLLSFFVVAETSISERADPPNTILFLCPYGGAKSVIAASYFNRLARESGLPLMGVAAATDEPYDRVPPAVAALLAQEDIDVSKHRPRRVEKEDIVRAQRIVAIDCDLSKTDTGSRLAERWDDVPKVSEDLPAATRAIRGHVKKLVQELAGAQESSRYDKAPSDWVSSSVRTCTPP